MKESIQLYSQFTISKRYSNAIITNHLKNLMLKSTKLIMKPRKFGLFKIQLKVMFKKNTGEELSEIDLEMLIRQNVLVHHETNNSVLKLRE